MCQGGSSAGAQILAEMVGAFWQQNFCWVNDSSSKRPFFFFLMEVHQLWFWGFGRQGKKKSW